MDVRRLVSLMIAVGLALAGCEGSLPTVLQPAPTPTPTVAPSPTPEPKPPLEVSFSSDKEEYKVGDQIRFTAVYTNNTTEVMTVTNMLIGGGFMSFSSGSPLNPGEGSSSEFGGGGTNDLRVNKTGTFSVEHTATGESPTKTISTTAVLTVTVK